MSTLPWQPLDVKSHAFLQNDFFVLLPNNSSLGAWRDDFIARSVLVKGLRLSMNGHGYVFLAVKANKSWPSSFVIMPFKIYHLSHCFSF